MRDSTKNYYEILHLHPSAPAEVIEAAYRRLARLYHPDVNQSAEAHDLMVQINLAYGVLSDPEKRADYDKLRETQSTSSSRSQDSEPRANYGNRPSERPSPRGRAGTDKAVEFITLRSSKDDVARIQGPPENSESDPESGIEVWYFDFGRFVTFDSFGLVQGWMQLDWPDSEGRLRVKMIPGPNTSLSYFTEGDHRDEVARLQGTPINLLVNEDSDQETWEFEKNGKVYFKHTTGRVIDWEGSRAILRVRGGGRPKKRYDSSTSEGAKGSLNLMKQIRTLAKRFFYSITYSAPN